MPDQDDQGDRLRREFERQDPRFDLHSSLPAKVSALIRRRRRRRRIVTMSIVVAAIAAVVIPLASLHSSPGQKSFNPVSGKTSKRPTPTSTPSVTTTSPPTTLSPPTSQTTVPTTTVMTFNPWTEAGRLSPGFTVLGHVSGGSCFTALGSTNSEGQTSEADTSIGDPSNENAWRCISDNGIYDPCFAPIGKSDVTELACSVSPYLKDDVYLLEINQPIPTNSARAKHTGLWPLVLVLQNGDQCEVIQGTAIRAGFNYGCNDGNATNPSTASEPWTVTYLPNGSNTSVTMTVTTVWE
jgi:hypothetical protein